MKSDAAWFRYTFVSALLFCAAVPAASAYAQKIPIREVPEAESGAPAETPGAARPAKPGFGTLTLPIPEQPADYVTDLTGSLTPAELSALNAKLAAYERETSNQFYFLVARSLGGRDVFDVTFEIAERWKPGVAGRDNGVLTALYLDDRKLRIEVGYGLEGAIPDAIAKRIIDEQMAPALRAGDTAGALNAAADALMDAARGEYQPVPQTTGEIVAARYQTLLPLAGLAILFLLLAAISDKNALTVRLAETTRADEVARAKLTRRVDFSEFFSSFIAYLIIGVILGVVTGVVLAFLTGMGLQLYSGQSVLSQAQTVLLTLVSVGGALATLALGAAFYFFRRGADEAREIRLKLADESTIREWRERFDPDSIDHEIARFRRLAASLRPAALYYGEIEALSGRIKALFANPSQHFIANFKYAEERIPDLLVSPRWEKFRAEYDPAHVDELLDKFQKLWSAALSTRNAEKADYLLDELTACLDAPGKSIDRRAAPLIEEMQTWLGETEVWDGWRNKFDEKKVDAHYALIKRRAGEFKVLDPADPEARRKINNFWRTNVQDVKKRPEDKFKPDPPPRTYTSSSSSSWSSSSSGSWSSSSSSSSSWSSSSSSSSSSSRGGSFGGGGASGGW